jgi:hypothetical protein
MQHLLLTISDSTNMNALKTALMKHKGVQKVEKIDTTTQPEEADWKNRLHLPGPPLTAEQIEEIVDDMDNESDEGSTLDELTADLNEKFKEKWGVGLIQ